MKPYAKDKLQGELGAPSLIHILLKYIDIFLPRSLSEMDNAVRFKARFAILDMLIGALITFAGMLAENVPAYTFLSFLFFAQHVGFLIWLRISRKTELVITTFVVSSLVISCILTFGLSKSILTPGQIFWFRLMMLSFILCKFEVSALIWGVIVAASILLWPFGLQAGFQAAFQGNFSQITENYIFRVVTLNIWALASVAAFRILLRLTNESVQRESEWIIRSTKIRQLAVLAGSLSSLFESSIRKIQNELRHLEEFRNRPDFSVIERRAVRNIEVSHKKILEASRSFSIIYRAQKDEMASKVTLPEISNHVRLLLSEPLEKLGWRLTVQHSEQPVVLNVQIAKFLLLLVSISHQMLDEGKISMDRELTFSTQVEGDDLSLTISMKRPADSPSLEGDELILPSDVMTQDKLSIIQELLGVCGARMTLFRQGNSCVTKLQLSLTVH